jgi:hypothetical protein
MLPLLDEGGGGKVPSCCVLSLRILGLSTIASHLTHSENHGKVPTSLLEGGYFSEITILIVRLSTAIEGGCKSLISKVSFGV